MELPDEIWGCICEHLSGEDVARVACVSTTLKAVATDEALWEKRCRKQFHLRMPLRDTWKASYVVLKRKDISILLIEARTCDEFLDNVLKGLAEQGFRRITTVRIRRGGVLGEWHSFPVEKLVEYDVVLTWCDECYKGHEVMLGDSLAELMDHGGAAVITTFATNFHGNGLLGRFVTENYGAFVLGDQIDYKRCCLGERMEPSHPLLANVKSFLGGSGSYHSDVKVEQGAQLIANWDDGVPLIAYKRCGVDDGGCNVMLNFYPVNSEVDPECWDAETDGFVILSNALLFAVSQAQRKNTTIRSEI